MMITIMILSGIAMVMGIFENFFNDKDRSSTYTAIACAIFVIATWEPYFALSVTFLCVYSVSFLVAIIKKM